MARHPVSYDTVLQKLGYTETTTGLWFPLQGTFPPEAVDPGTGGGGGDPDPPDDPGTGGEPVDLTTAAGRLGWGIPVGGDEMNYVGEPDPDLWSVYDSPGHNGNGVRSPARVTVDGTKMILTGLAGAGNTAGLEHTMKRRYGRYEARVRSYYTGDPGSGVPVGQTTKFTEDFELGNLSRWNSVQTHAYDGSPSGYNVTSNYQLKIVNAGAGHETALRTEVRDGDTAVGSHERAELSGFGKTPINNGDEQWYEFDVKFGDTTFPSIDQWDIFFQWHQVNDEGAPALALAVHSDGKVYFEREPDGEIEFIEAFTVTPGVWQHLVVHVKWSPNASTGFIQMHRDGVEVVPKTMCKTMYTTDNTDPYYIKCGQYRRSSNTSTSIVYHDKIRVSTTPVSTSTSGTGGYHPVLIVWPSDGSSWPYGGEYDWLENGEPGEAAAGCFHHFPSLDGADHKREMPGFPVDLKQWNNIAFEWSPTGLRGWVNGQEWYTTSGGAAADRKNIQDMVEGQVTVQLDAFQPTGNIASAMEVEWLRIYDLTPTSGGGGGGGGGTPPVIGPPLNLTGALTTPTAGGAPRLVTTVAPPGVGTAVAYQWHELRKYPTDTLKATTAEPSRTTGGLNPATLEYAAKAVDADGNVSAFSNTIVVTVTAAGATISPGQPAGWDSSAPGTGGGTVPDPPGGGTDPGGGDGTPSTGTIPWTRTFRDGSRYNPPTGGDGLTAGTAGTASALSTISSNATITYTGSPLTSTVTIAGKSNFTLKGVKLGTGGKLVINNCSNFWLDDLDLQVEPSSNALAGDVVALRGVGSRAGVRNSVFGPATYSEKTGVTSTVQFLAVLDAVDHVYLDKVTFRNKSTPGNAYRIYGDYTATGGCQYSVASQVLWQNCYPFKENDQEMARFGTSDMMQTVGHHIVEFSRVENVQTEPELLSFKMNYSTCRGSTFVDCVGSPVFRHGNDGEIHDCYMVGDKSVVSPSGSTRTSAGFRGYGRGHKVHHNTIRVNGTANYERPLILDGGDTSPDALSNGHANVVGWDVYRNLLVKCGAPIVIGANYGTPPSGCAVHDNWVVECANAGSTGIMVVSGASAAGVTAVGNSVFGTTAGAGLTQGASGEWKAPAAADRGARSPFVTTGMAGKGATWDPWNGLAGGGGTTPPPDTPPSTGVTYPMDLMPDHWKLTLAIAAASGSGPLEVKKDGSPDLDTYVHDQWFKLNAAKDGIIMACPFDGVTTSGSSNVRTEFREMTADGKSNASWSVSSGTHTLEVDTQIDRLDGNHVVLAQIHGASDDLTVFRLEGTTLWITDGDTTHGYQARSGVALGTRMRLKIVAGGGKVKYYVDDVKVNFELSASDSGCYFKAGNYLQKKGSSGSWTQVTLRKAVCTHS